MAAIAALTLGGCASGGYDGGYDGGYSGGYGGGYDGGYSGGYDGGYYTPYPAETYSYNSYYYGGPYYYGDGGYYGGGAFSDSEDEFHHRHSRDDHKDSNDQSHRHSDPRVGSGGSRPRAMPDDQRNAFNAQPDRHLNRQMPQQPQVHGMFNNDRNVPLRPRPNAQPEPCPPKGCSNR